MGKQKKKGIGYIFLLLLLVIFLAPCLMRIFPKDEPDTGSDIESTGDLEDIDLDKENIYF